MIFNELFRDFAALISLVWLLAVSNLGSANWEWLGTRDEMGNVRWDCVGIDLPFPAYEASAALEINSGPGKFNPNSAFVFQGEWHVAGGERSCGAHGELWKWQGSNWTPVHLKSPQPNPSKPHVAWSEDDHLVWLELDRSLIWHEYHPQTQGWLMDQRSANGPWIPESTPLVLEDYVVWASANSDLYILNKISGEMAHFPNDAWASYLLQAEQASFLRISDRNVFEFGQNVHRMNRYDFNEKVRFADFKQVFRQEDAFEINGLGRASWIPWVLLVLSWSFFLSWQWTHSKLRSKQRRFDSLERIEEVPPPVVESERAAGIAHWSIPLKLLVLSNRKKFSSAEIDELFDLTEILSPETLRAKRSRMIQSVNTEFNLLFGYDLIRRKREDKDRRKVVYHLSALPPNLAKMLQRNGMHEFHADDSPNRADSITEDRE